MSDEVKKVTEAASTQEEVKKDDVAASPTKEEVAELAEALAQSLEREDKTAKERDNYKQGMLKAKGKLKASETEEEEVTTETKDTSSELIGVVKTLLKRNQEMETALVNRSQISTAGQGSSSETKVEVGDNLLSPDQLKDLKGRGWNDEKIARLKAHLQKARS